MTDEKYLANVDTYSPRALFIDDPKALAVVAEIEKQTRSIVFGDVAEPEARQNRISVAYKVRRSKTFVDEEGKKLTKVKRDEIKTIDDLRREVRDRLDALATEIRGPVDEWEEEQDRIDDEFRAKVEAIEDVKFSDQIAALEDQIEALEAIESTEEEFGPYASRAESALSAAIARGWARLGQLQAEDRERERVAALEAENRKLREIAEKAEAEAKKKADAAAKRKAERERKAREKKEAAERAEREAREAEERKTREEEIAREAAERAARETEERLRREAQEAADKAEAEEQARRMEERLREEEAEAKRISEQNVARVDALILAALFGPINDEKTASAVLELMKRGQIPHVKIEY